jgi:diguanylate cyclase (GGDEF)-like protein/PAS domain S-box-containing protein
MEDDPGLSRLLQKSLQRRGYVVETAADGEEGLAKVSASPFDLLLLDYDMPFRGGLEVIRTLRAKNTLPPTIMITGQGNEDIAVEALKLGATDYIVKDVEMKYLELLPVVIDRALYQEHMIRERAQLEAAARESEERYRRLVELSPDGIAVHAEGKVVFINPTGARFLGAKGPEELIGRNAFDLVHPEFRELAEERARQMLSRNCSVPWIEERFLRLDGGELQVEVAGVTFPYQGKPAVQIMFRDITDRKQIEERLERLALYDTLTKLPNRTLFFDRLRQLLAMAKRHRHVLALLYMDLDRFKTVNDTLGHEIGDLLLTAAARRMQSCTRGSDTVARMGGDEFIGICGRIAEPKDAGVVAEKIIAMLAEPFLLKGHQCSIGASIGISLYPHDGDDAETLVNKADAAMYRVKEQGKGGYAYISAI